MPVVPVVPVLHVLPAVHAWIVTVPHSRMMVLFKHFLSAAALPPLTDGKPILLPDETK